MKARPVLHAAVLELTKSDPGKTRLANCVTKYLSTMSAADLPVAAQGLFAALLQSLTTVTPLRGETAIHATIRKMSNAEADACAARIVDLYAHCLRVETVPTEPDAAVQSATIDILSPRQATLRYDRSH
jgi:hypothetical protein